MSPQCSTAADIHTAGRVTQTTENTDADITAFVFPPRVAEPRQFGYLAESRNSRVPPHGETLIGSRAELCGGTGESARAGLPEWNPV